MVTTTAAPPFHIRDPAPSSLANRPSDGHRGIGSDAQQNQRMQDGSDDLGWNASTGSALTRNRQLLSRARFVKEGELSRTWTGNWGATESEDVVDDAIEKGTPSPITDLRAGLKENLVDAKASDSSAQSTMASLYAQLAANLKTLPPKGEGLSDTTLSLASFFLEPSVSTRLPRLETVPLRGNRESGRKGKDWFANTAPTPRPRNSHPYTSGGASRKSHHRTLDVGLPTETITSPRPLTDHGEAFEGERLVAELRPMASAVASVPSFLLEETPESKHAACPTCSAMLPYPCPSATLRSHLSSMAHRLCLPRLAPPPASTSASHNDDDKSGSRLKPKLHLNEDNAGWKLLIGMGWEEGMGVGKSEWEYLLARQREEVQEREGMRMRKRKRRKTDRIFSNTEQEAQQMRAKESKRFVIIISSDESQSGDDSDGSTPRPSHQDNLSCDDEPEDVFNLSPPACPPCQSSRSQSSDVVDPMTSSSDLVDASPTLPQLPRPEPRLVPLSIKEKHDRLGLGLSRRDSNAVHFSPPSSSSSSSINPHLIRGDRKGQKRNRADESVLISLRRKEWERRDRREKEEWMTLRDSLR